MVEGLAYPFVYGPASHMAHRVFVAVLSCTVLSSVEPAYAECYTSLPPAAERARRPATFGAVGSLTGPSVHENAGRKWPKYMESHEKEPHPPSGRLKPARVGRLDTVGAVACELARLYRQARRGEIDVASASRLATILTALKGCLETADVERRIADLEQLAAAHSPSERQWGKS
jgi:hypothetical protein